QDKIVLEANPDYFLGRPLLDRLIFRYASQGTVAIALKTGEADLGGLKPADLPQDEAGAPDTVSRYKALYVDFILWNLPEPRGLFTAARVRRALAMAFDREAYVSKIQRGFGAEAVSIFPPHTWAHDASLSPLPYDPNAARSLLASAGWRDRDGDGVLD